VLNRQDAPGPLQGEFLIVLQRSIASLNTLLEDLLMLSRVEAGQEQRKIDMFDAASLLGELCSATKTFADERGLFLEIHGPVSLPVQGDIVKIRRIAQNLLLNALKYTERGGVRVTWGEHETEGLARWTICVQDTGPGLGGDSVAPLAQALERSTEESRAVDKEVSAMEEPAGAAALPSLSTRKPDGQSGGEGIGLSIVKRLCELLDASVEVETEPGKGSTFRIVFPRRYDAP
jgi:signal transduction histidine kinase